MSQNLIAADFKGEYKKIVYVTNDRAYALAQKDECQVMTGDNYDVKSVKMLVVMKK
jgi:hypothetical protein